MAQTKRKRRVLVVEDEDSFALALDFLMTREGYDHTRIADGAKALPLIRDMQPDLVLLTVILPGASGHEICQGVQPDPDLADTKILMMTARGSSIERRKRLAIGADDVIT